MEEETLCCVHILVYKLTVQLDKLSTVGNVKTYVTHNHYTQFPYYIVMQCSEGKSIGVRSLCVGIITHDSIYYTKVSHIFLFL